LLAAGEMSALVRRARHLAEHGRYPEPGSRWSYPWPLI
jgi:hypothetical protein